MNVDENSIFVLPPYFDDENDDVTMSLDLSDAKFASLDNTLLLFKPK